MRSNGSYEGLDNEMLCGIGYSEFPRSIKVIGGRWVAPYSSCLEGIYMLYIKKELIRCYLLAVSRDIGGNICRDWQWVRNIW